MTSPRSPRLTEIATVVGAVATLGAALLPWHRSGDVRRNGFGLARAVGRLDLVDGALPRAALWAWFAVPALVAGVWLAATLRRRGVVAGLAGTVGVVAVLASVVVVGGRADAEIGPWVALVVGALTVAAAARLGWETRRRT